MTTARPLHSAGIVALSVFIVWHAVGIAFVGPSGDSQLRRQLLEVWRPYLDFLQLNRRWAFFAPDVAYGSFFEYEVLRSSGTRERYPLSHALHRFHPAYFRHTSFYYYLFDGWERARARGYDRSVARYLCRLHGTEAVSIHFVRHYQRRFTAADYRLGKRPLDPAFVDDYVDGPYACDSL
jgi:hypothetical protein